MKFHLPCRFRRAIVWAMFAAVTVVATPASVTRTDMIPPDGNTVSREQFANLISNK